MSDQIFQPMPQPPKPPKTTSLRATLLIFVSAFIMLLVILNLPTIAKAITYPFTHSPESDNEKLTQQYRDIYGYEKHPEIMNAVQQNVDRQPSPSMFPITTPAQFDGQISIPKINVVAPILQVNNSDDATILATLKNGVVLYPGSVTPGQSGTAIIVGHSSSDLPWTKYSAIFSLLGNLQPDDLIYVTVNGTQYIYRIDTIKKGSSQELIDSGLTGDLILTTCWPIGTDRNRIAVSATRIQ